MLSHWHGQCYKVTAAREDRPPLLEFAVHESKLAGRPVERRRDVGFNRASLFGGSG